MKRLCACVLCTVLLFSLSACYGPTRTVVTTEPPTTVAPSNQPPSDSVGLAYTVNADGKTCTVTGIGTCTDTDLRIGEKIDGYTVTAITNETFDGGEHLTSMILPRTLTSISAWAFVECPLSFVLYYQGNADDWTHVRVDESAHGCVIMLMPTCYFYSEGEPAEIGYFWCYVNGVPTVWAGLRYTLLEDGTYEAGSFGHLTEKVVNIPATHNGKPVTRIAAGAFRDNIKLEEVTIPDGVTSIGQEAFSWCRRLIRVSLPSSLTSIEEGAFNFCPALTSIDLPDGITRIEDEVFSSCSALTSLDIPDNVTFIADKAFANCRGISSITIPDKVTSIGEKAFSGCSALRSISIPANVTTIGKQAFANCDRLTSITVEDDNPVYHSDGNCIIETRRKTLIAGCQTSIIPTDGSVQHIGDGAFYYLTTLESITIPDSVTSIGKEAFYMCYTLESVDIPDSVTSLGDSAFASCYQLAEVTLPHALDTIGTKAFSHCQKITAITIPDSVTTIGEKAFNTCQGLTEIIIPAATTDIALDAFAACNDLQSIQVAIGNPVYHASGNCLIETASKTLILGCQSSVIPTDGSVTSIGKKAFYMCYNLTEITIPNNITSIGEGAFESCSRLKSIAIPTEATVISKYAFNNCDSLTNILLPNSRIQIEEYAFNRCYSLVNVFFEGTGNDWYNQILIDKTGNNFLTSANVFFYDEDSEYPAQKWHYVDGVPTPW